ncbi:hypothetical protein E4U58_006520, partial [Claviceps cyperi]
MAPSKTQKKKAASIVKSPTPEVEDESMGDEAMSGAEEEVVSPPSRGPVPIFDADTEMITSEVECPVSPSKRQARKEESVLIARSYIGGKIARSSKIVLATAMPDEPKPSSMGPLSKDAWYVGFKGINEAQTRCGVMLKFGRREPEEVRLDPYLTSGPQAFICERRYIILLQCQRNSYPRPGIGAVPITDSLPNV